MNLRPGTWFRFSPSHLGFYLVLILLPAVAGCGLTSVQNEVSWYRQQLTISEDDRHRLELELADCEQMGQRMAASSGELRGELDQARAELVTASARLEGFEDGSSVITAEGFDLDVPGELSGIEGVEATIGEGNEIRITLDDTILFSAGSVAIRKSGSRALSQIASAIGNNYRGRQIRVEGHTDSSPPARVKNRYPTNWELSTARACVVLRKLIDLGAVDSKEAAAVGFGDQRPVADNATKAGRAQNRRVEVIVD